MDIAIIAGTRFDTYIGVRFVEKYGYKGYGYPISKNPDEQSQLQILYPKKLRQEVENILRKIIEKDIRKVLIFCNSLSGALDLEKLYQYKELQIVTPLDVYSGIACKLTNIAVITANNQSAFGIERVITGKNPKCNVIGIGILPLVRAIEEKLNPEYIIKDFALKELFHFFHKIGCQGIILGCTHFPYLMPDLLKISPLPVIDPAEEMLNIIKREL
jgi:glutamate racemase